MAGILPREWRWCWLETDPMTRVIISGAFQQDLEFWRNGRVQMQIIIIIIIIITRALDLSKYIELTLCCSLWASDAVCTGVLAYNDDAKVY